MTNTPRLLLLKLLKAIFFGQMVNIAVFLLMLVEKTIDVPIFYIRMNISHLLLKYTESIGNSFLVC